MGDSRVGLGEEGTGAEKNIYLNKNNKIFFKRQGLSFIGGACCLSDQYSQINLASLIISLDKSKMTSSRYFKWNVLCYVKMLRLLWYGSGKCTGSLLCLHFLFTSKYHHLLEGPPEVCLTQKEIKKAGF